MVQEEWGVKKKVRFKKRRDPELMTRLGSDHLVKKKKEEKDSARTPPLPHPNRDNFKKDRLKKKSINTCISTKGKH